MIRRLTRPLFAGLRRRARHRRYRQIQELVDVESMPGFVLDVGGGPASFFAAIFPRPRQVILVELDPAKALRAKLQRPDLAAIVADGERLPLADRTVAATVCNSVIEHVNDPADLANEIRRVSRSYFLQTPNQSFPLETHSFFPIPCYNLIPWMWMRRVVCRVFGANLRYLNSVHYLSEEELKALFPEAIIAYERALGMKKSFYVYYSATGRSR